MVARIVAFGQSSFSSLRRRNFRLYFTGQSISQVGGWMQAVAQSWLVLHLTGSATALGVVSALQFAPTLVLGPYAGVLADRVAKRRLLFVTQSAAGLLALILGIAVATDTVQTWVVFATAGCLGLVNALDYPTRQAFLYELAGPREVVSAVGLTGTATNLARVAGPAAAGFIIAGLGLAACFMLNAASFVAVLVCLFLMRPAEFHRAERSPARGGLRKGFGYAMRTPALRASLVMMAIVGTLTYEFSVTLPAFVKITLGGSAAALGYLMSAMGVGAAIGGLVTAGRRGDGIGRLAVAALAFGTFTGLVGLAPNVLVATVLMVFVGIFAARFTGLSNGIVQLRSAPAMRNRTVALWSTAFLGSTFLGGPLLGWIAQTVGPRWSLGAGLIGGALGGLVGFLAWRKATTAEHHSIERSTLAEERAAS